MNSQSALAWILLHLMIPVVAIPVYFLFGDFRIRGYVKKHRKGTKLLQSALKPEIAALLPSAENAPREVQRTFLPLKDVLDRCGPVYSAVHANAELLVDGTATFEAIFEAIKDAEDYILVQYYILRSDKLGAELKRLLIEKAKAGIPVYMLLDDMGSFWLSRNYVRDLKRAGVKLARFLPIASIKRFFQSNFRNHRKLVVVDGKVAFSGGLNVGEEYIASRSKKSMKRYWRDTHVKIAGSSVYLFEDVFLDDWFFATGEKIVLPLAQHKLTRALDEHGDANPIVQVVPTGPTDDVVVSVLFVLQMINSATKRLWIATPYFVPDLIIIRALELAALRGVDVRIMLPQESDNRVVQWVSLSFAESMRKRGIHFLLYQPGFMHQKVFLVDDTLSAIGTMNLDNRAMYLNFETMAVIHSKKFGDEVRAMLEDDFLNCRYVQPLDNSIKSRFLRLRGNTARLLAPLL